MRRKSWAMCQILYSITSAGPSAQGSLTWYEVGRQQDSNDRAKSLILLRQAAEIGPRGAELQLPNASAVCCLLHIKSMMWYA